MVDSPELGRSCEAVVIDLTLVFKNLLMCQLTQGLIDGGGPGGRSTTDNSMNDHGHGATDENVEIAAIAPRLTVNRSPPLSLLSQEKWLQVVIGAFVLAYCMSTLIVHRQHGYNMFWDGIEYNIAAALPMIPMLLRARRSPAQRWSWRFMAGAVALYTIANLIYTYHDRNLNLVSSLAPSSAFYLLGYVAAVIGIALLTQGRNGRVRVSVRLDGLITGVAISSAAALLWFEPLLSTSGRPIQVIIGMAYPVCNLVIIVLIVASLAPNRYRPNWTMALLLAGALWLVVGDVIYLKQVAAGTYVSGTFLDGTWLIGISLIGLAASTRDRRRSGAPRTAVNSSPDIAFIPAASGFLAIGVGVVSAVERDSNIGIILAATTLGLVIVRMWMTLREERHLTASSEIDARTDALTGLPNRRMILEQIEADLCSEDVETVGVILIDLDDFKEVNDALGHLAGDELLSVLAKRFETRFGGRGVLARLGGDEFAVVIGGASEEDLVTIAHGLLAVLSDPCVLDGVSVRVSASMGVAVSPAEGSNAVELLRRGDVAMYEAKRMQSGISVYAAGKDPNSREHLALLGDLRQAIEARTFTLHYQPTIDMRTGQVRGVEALARWHHPGLGMLYPDAFIPMAERAGLMPPFTRTILELAVVEAARLDRAGHKLHMSVNISRYDLVDEDLPDFIENLLGLHGFPPGRLTLEITESSFGKDPDRVAQCVNDLRERGIRISIDDFGVGYSSMSQLLRLPIDELKVDKSFVIGLCSDVRAQAIVRSAIELARAFDLSLVAEGIEDEAVLQLLQNLGVDIGQGYFIAGPLTSEQFDDFLAHPHRSSRACFASRSLMAWL